MSAFLPGLPGGGGGLPTLPILPPTTTRPPIGVVQNAPVNIGLNIPGLGNVNVGLPGGSGPQSGGVNISAANLQSASLGFLANPIGYLFGSSLLRIAFFILGFIFIIMGLYMLKQTNFIVAPVVNVAKGAVKDSVKAAVAA